jgi:hypothetical protein
MGIRFATGQGYIYAKETPDLLAGRVSYQLTEIDGSKYTKPRWWGDFSTREELAHLGNFFIQFEDGRRGECVVIGDTEASSDKTRVWYYHFNGRGKFSRRR